MERFLCPKIQAKSKALLKQRFKAVVVTRSAWMLHLRPKTRVAAQSASFISFLSLFCARKALKGREARREAGSRSSCEDDGSHAGGACLRGRLHLLLQRKTRQQNKGSSSSSSRRQGVVDARLSVGRRISRSSLARSLSLPRLLSSLLILFAVSRLDSRAAAAVVVLASLDQATCAAASLAHRETDTGCSRLLARGSRVHCLPSASLVPSFGTRLPPLLLQSLLRSTADFARCVLRCFLGIRSRGSKACFHETHLRLLLLLRAICLHPRQLICW